MGKTLNLTGKRFGRLTAICIDHVHPKLGAYWRCKCDCGNEIVTASSHLKNGYRKSCGCLKKELLIESSKVHNKKYCVLGTKVDNSVKKSDLCTRRDNKSGYTGVSYHKSRDLWLASCYFQGHKYGKSFRDKEDAIKFRKLMKEKRDEFIKWYDSLSSEEKENLTDNDKIYFKSLFKSKMDELFDKEVLNK